MWCSSQKHPTTYYFIDFELAIRFDPRSDLNPWVVSGLPMEGFQRVAAPEVRGLIPYCPFKADVYALGFIYYKYFRVSRHADCSIMYTYPVLLAMRTMVRICDQCLMRYARGGCQSTHIRSNHVGGYA